MTQLRENIQTTTIPEHDNLSSTRTSEDQKIFRSAALLGFAVGLRSLTPFALLSQVETDSPAQDTAQSRFFGNPRVKTVTSLAAIGEIIADKLPIVPSRLSTGPLLGRVLFGALTGALLCQRFNRPLLQGASRGALGAVLGSVIGYAYRTLAGNVTDIPDFIWALLEDGTAVTLGKFALNELPRNE